MPPTWSQNEVTVGQNAVLAWAATSAVALNLSTVAQSALVLMMQQRYNAAIPLMQSLGVSPLSRITEDGQWGGQSALAALRFLAISRGADEPGTILADIVTAFGASASGTGVGTTTALRARFSALRDAVTSYGNRTHGVAQGIAQYATTLLDAVRLAGTTADVGARARDYLGALYMTGAAPSLPAAQVVSTRTPPDTKTLQQATQTPSVDPNIVSASQEAGSTPTEMTLPGVDVVGRPWSERVNLKVVIPSVLVGTLFLVWAYKQTQKRGRR